MGSGHGGDTPPSLGTVQEGWRVQGELSPQGRGATPPGMQPPLQGRTPRISPPPRRREVCAQHPQALRPPPGVLPGGPAPCPDEPRAWGKGPPCSCCGSALASSALSGEGDRRSISLQRVRSRSGARSGGAGEARTVTLPTPALRGSGGGARGAPSSGVRPSPTCTPRRDRCFASWGGRTPFLDTWCGQPPEKDRAAR